MKLFSYDEPVEGYFVEVAEYASAFFYIFHKLFLAYVMFYPGMYIVNCIYMYVYMCVYIHTHTHVHAHF